ncbi:MAG: helix-turn-helix transcriptional regulator [Spirochaetes bacterium]|nr:helix-turn-helix transcriptional regulator [Spirochaetota bacterium]
MNRAKASKKQLSTFDRIMKDPKRRERFEKGYNQYLVNEFLLEAMEENNISVRKLAGKAGVSPAIIQRIRSGNSSNITLKKLNALAAVLGYRINFRRIKF